MPNTLTISLAPGYTFGTNELVTIDKLNLLSRPTVALLGSVTTAALDDGIVTTAKLATGALSANTLGWQKMADAYVITAKLADAAVTTVKLADANVTGAKLDDSARKDLHQYAAGVYAVGPPGVYAVTLAPVPLSYSVGMVIRFKADTANTANAGAASVNVNGLGNKLLVRGVATGLLAGDIAINQFVTAIYDGTNFVISTPLGYAASEAVVASARNLLIQNNGGAPNSKADISADEFVLKDATTGRTLLASTVAVTVDIGLGVAVNGLDAGVEAASTWYYFWLIYNGTTVSGLVSASATAPILPAGYTYKGLAGTVFNNAGSNFITFYQSGRTISLVETVVFNNLTGVTGWTGRTILGSDGLWPPAITRSISGSIGVSGAANGGIAVAADTNALGAVACSGTRQGNPVNSFLTAAPYTIPIKTTLFYAVIMGATDANNYRMTISGFTI